MAHEPKTKAEEITSLRPPTILGARSSELIVDANGCENWKHLLIAKPEEGLVVALLAALDLETVTITLVPPPPRPTFHLPVAG